MAIYRRLFFGNLSNLFARNFPVMRRILPDAEWNGMIRSFMTNHRSSTPFFPEIGEELVLFLADNSIATISRFVEARPWLPELAQWEYAETRARLSDSELHPATDREPEWSTSQPILNPTLQVGRFHWPVHRISPAFVPTEQDRAPIILLAFRNRRDKVAFMQINELTLSLLVSLKEQPELPGQLHVRRLAAGHPDGCSPEMMQAGLKLLDKLYTNQVLVGHVTTDDSQAANL